jgi:cytidylate kinase
VAIDGPAAAGKTTVARALAGRLDAIFIDTGLLYRAVTLAALRSGIPPSDGARLAELTRSLDLSIAAASRDGRQCDLALDGVDVTDDLRSSEIDASVSEVSAHPGVREALLPLQRRLAGRGPVVMVGRDITTVVIPDAGVKIYLDASLRERAHRRWLELRGRAGAPSLEAVEADLARRDEADSTREASPLQAAADAIVVDTDNRSVGEIVDEIATLVHRTWRSLGVTSHE